MKIKNWKKFQHFKDRRPPWIKLHREMLDQRDINVLSDASFRTLVNLWLLASEDEEKLGKLPPVIDIAHRLRTDEKKINKALQELSEFVIHDDNCLISPCHQDVPPETEGETEGETKHSHGEHGNVKLTSGEFLKIEDYTGGRGSEYIDTLDRYLAQNTKRYKSHYAVLQNFYRRDVDSGKVKERPAVADINKFL